MEPLEARERQGDNQQVGFEREPHKVPVRTAEPREGESFDTIGLREPEHPQAKLRRPGCKTIRNEGFTQEIGESGRNASQCFKPHIPDPASPATRFIPSL